MTGWLGSKPRLALFAAALLALGAGWLLMLHASSWRLSTAPEAGSYELIAVWTGGSVPSGPFRQPTGVAVDSSGSIFVTDGKPRVMRLRPDGSHVQTWDEKGDGPGQFRRPDSVAVGPGDSVFVTDFENDRVQKFTYEGLFVTSFD